MLSIIAAIVLAAHGAIHVIGFVVPWQLASVDGFPYRTTVLAGLIDVGPVGIRAIGAAWLLIAAGFVLAGVAVWRGGAVGSRLLRSARARFARPLCLWPA